MKTTIEIAATIFFVPVLASAQNLSSGSTGADGALDLSQISENTLTLQVPASGVFNFTTVNIPGGKTLYFRPSFGNAPVIMLAQGGVNIGGTINVDASFDYSASRYKPGPGGFYGGAPSQSGFGPGAGRGTEVVGSAENGRWVGPSSLVPIIGGSGGHDWPGPKTASPNASWLTRVLRFLACWSKPIRRGHHRPFSPLGPG